MKNLYLKLYDNQEVEDNKFDSEIFELIYNNVEDNIEDLRKTIVKYGKRNINLTYLPPTTRSFKIKSNSRDLIKSYTYIHRNGYYTEWR